jgi:hypothetical protein
MVPWHWRDGKSGYPYDEQARSLGDIVTTTLVNIIDVGLLARARFRRLRVRCRCGIIASFFTPGEKSEMGDDRPIVSLDLTT